MGPQAGQDSVLLQILLAEMGLTQLLTGSLASLQSSNLEMAVLGLPYLEAEVQEMDPSVPEVNIGGSAMAEQDPLTQS